jgi:uncharacterized protein YeaO (DUF488 family)
MSLFSWLSQKKRVSPATTALGRTTTALDEATQRSIFAEFMETYESEMKKGQDNVFAKLRVAPGQDVFFVMGAAAQHFAQSSEAKDIRKACLLQTASKFKQSLRQVETVVSRGNKEKW